MLGLAHDAAGEAPIFTLHLLELEHSELESDRAVLAAVREERDWSTALQSSADGPENADALVLRQLIAAPPGGTRR